MSDKFAKALTDSRSKLGLSQAAMARRLGITQASISMLERGGRDPALATAQRLAELMDVPVEQLLATGHTGDRRPSLAKLMQVADQLSDNDVEVLHAVAVTLLRTKRGGKSVKERKG